MPENELRVTITAESSGLTAGLADATSQVQTAATSMAAAQQQATVAAQNLASAQQQLGAAAAAGNAQAAAVIQQYAGAAATAAAAVRQLGVAEAGTAAATEQMTRSINRASAAIPPLRWSMRDAANATTGFGVSARQTASGGIGMLEGRMMSGNRAAAAFLSTTLGLGPVLQAAFPVIGAAALVEVLIDIGGEIKKVISEISTLSDTLNTGWIETAVGKLEGMGSAFESLAKDIKEAQNATDAATARQKETAFEIIGLQQGRAAEDSARIVSIEQQNAGIRMQIDMLKQRSNIERGVAGGSISSAFDAFQQRLPNQLFSPEATANANAADAEVRKLTADLAANNLEMTKLSIQAEDTAQHVHHALKPPKDETLRDFVQESIADYERMQAESQKIGEAIQQTFNATVRADEEATRRSDELHRQSVEEWKRTQEEKVAAAREEAQAQILAAGQAYEQTQLQIRQQEELGIVSHRTATQMLLDAERLKEQTTEGALKKEAGLFNPAYGEQEAREFKKLEDQMTAESRKGALERQRIEQQETQQFIQLWRRATAEFNSDFTTALNAWATHQQTAGKAFGEMLGTMEKQVMDFTAKTILEHAEMWAELKIMQALGLLEQKGQQAAANAATVVSDAGVAAAGTMAYYSAINPPIAPAMAALQYGITLSYGAASAFEAGGVVAGGHGMPVPIIAHAGERVLSAAQTENFHNLVNSSRATSARLNYAPTFNGNAPSHADLEAHSRQMMQKLRGMLRPEAFQ